MPAPPSIPEHFDLPNSDTIVLQPVGIGHINDTYVGGETERFIFQRINTEIFPEVDHLMENFQRVTAHLTQAYSTAGSTRRPLHLVKTRSGESYHRTEDGDCWRAFHFVEKTVSHSVLSSPQQAREAASAFGEFSMLLSDLPAPPLHEIIPDFHNTAKRYANFLAAVEADPVNRASQAKAEIDAAIDSSSWATIITDAQATGEVPMRVAHNDSKLENLLFDTETDSAVCVIDLDTTMPGSILHDFGDLVRAGAATTGEDETDLVQVDVSLPAFTALAQGFLSACDPILTPTERRLLPVAGKVIVYEQALRFLTDYLQGDAYYRIKHPEQNIERARNQLHLARSLDRFEPELEVAVNRCSS